MSDKINQADIYVTDITNVTLHKLRLQLATAFKAGEDQVLAHTDWRRADEYAIAMTEHLEVSSHGRGSLSAAGVKIPGMTDFHLEQLRAIRERIVTVTEFFTPGSEAHLGFLNESRALAEIYLIIDALVHGDRQLR